MTQEEFYTAVLSKFDKIETRLGNLETDVSGIKTSVASLETKVGNIETSVASLETKVDKIETVQQQHTGKLNDIDTNVKYIWEDISKQEKRLNALKQAL